VVKVYYEPRLRSALALAGFEAPRCDDRTVLPDQVRRRTVDAG
jgi:hypothetical protein